MIPAGSAAFYDSIAPEYDAMLSRLPGDRWVREAFLGLVRKTVKPGSLLLDFGCGTGTDAAWYAGHGYRVTAFDQSPEMVNRLRKKYPEQTLSGAVNPASGDWNFFISEIAKSPKYDAVVSNFAVVNEIPDLKILFSSFADCLSRDGPVILSMLNPIRRTSTGLTGKQHPRRASEVNGDTELQPPNRRIYLHPVRELEEAAGKNFGKVAMASAGIFVDYDNGEYSWQRPVGFLANLEKKLWTIPPFSGMGKFVFLVFRKIS